MQEWKPISEKGQIFSNVGAVVALLISIAVCAVAFYQFTGALETEPGSYADNTITKVEEKGLTVFNLLTILAIVLVAATIIAVVVRAVGGYGYGAPREQPPREQPPA